ncbi:MAG: hypothetical protein H0W83_16215 [Planctomycetes bacterium]|nr:hypothetical protein [Planctomycetota bacterium]
MILALFAAAGCEPRQPPGQGEVVGASDNLLLHEGSQWGTPVEVLPPGPPDAHGSRWWQLRYADEIGGVRGSRLVIVDAHSAWAQHPYAGYVVRVPTSAKSSATNPVVVQEGAFILMVTPPAVVDDEKMAELEREVARLNALGGEAGLYPIFSLRTNRAGETAIVYGWQGDRGIQRDDRVSEWLTARTPYGAGTWVDLLPP